MNTFVKTKECCKECEFVKDCDEPLPTQGGGGPVRSSSFLNCHVLPYFVNCLSNQYLIFNSYASADMENVMRVASAACVIFLSWGKILSLNIRCLVEIALSAMILCLF